MRIGIKTSLKKWGSNVKIICHKAQKVVEWVPRGSASRYPYLAGDPLKCERWQGRGRCMFFADEVGEEDYISCFVNDGHSRWVTLIEPREGVGDSLRTGSLEMSIYNGVIIADNTTLEDRESELKRAGSEMGYSFLKDPRNLMAIYALKEGIVKSRETCVEESPERCRTW
ncbi:MAG: hypothetical protein QXG35_07265 [Nitrososphaerota archaeon]